MNFLWKKTHVMCNFTWISLEQLISHANCHVILTYSDFACLPVKSINLQFWSSYTYCIGFKPLTGSHTWFKLCGDLQGPCSPGPGVNLSGELPQGRLVFLQLDHELTGVDDVGHIHILIFTYKTKTTHSLHFNTLKRNQSTSTTLHAKILKARVSNHNTVNPCAPYTDNHCYNIIIFSRGFLFILDKRRYKFFLLCRWS